MCSPQRHCAAKRPLPGALTTRGYMKGAKKNKKGATASNKKKAAAKKKSGRKKRKTSSK